MTAMVYLYKKLMSNFREDAATFEEFNKILKEKLEEYNISEFDIKYRRTEISPLEEWMKRNLDKFGIMDIDYDYKKEDGLTFKVLLPDNYETKIPH